MKAFLQKTIFIILIVFLIQFSLVKVFENIYPAFPMEKKILDDYYNISESEDINYLILGNSHNMSISFEDSDIISYHLWQGGNDLSEVNYQLNTLVDKLNKPDAIIIPITYFTLWWNNTIDIKNNRSSLRRKYYYYIENFDWIKGDFKNYVRAKFSPITSMSYIKNLLKFLIKGEKGINNNFELRYDGYRLGSKYHNTMPDSSMIDNIVNYVVPRQTDILKSMYRSDTTIFNENVDLIKNIIKRSSKLGIKNIIFYTPPYYYRYTEEFENFYINETKKLMSEIVDNDISFYFDYSNDDRFIFEPKYFRDGHHMNISGAKIFTPILHEDIAH